MVGVKPPCLRRTDRLPIRSPLSISTAQVSTPGNSAPRSPKITTHTHSHAVCMVLCLLVGSNTKYHSCEKCAV